MTIDCYNKRTKEYYVFLGISHEVFVDTSYDRNHRRHKRVATLAKCLDVITHKVSLFNIREIKKIKPINIVVRKGAFLRRYKGQNLSRRAIYKVNPISIKMTKKEKHLGIF